MVDPDSSSLHVYVTDGRGARVADGGLARWLARVAPKTARGDLAIALVSDARMRTLNRSYRRKDYATDVLSFAADRRPATADRSRSDRGRRTADRGSRTADRGRRTAQRGRRTLGDVVIATGVARRQAREAGHSYATEYTLSLHDALPI